MRRPRICVALLTFLIVFITSTNGVGDHKKSRVLSSFTFKPPFFPDAGLSAVPGWEPRGTSIVTADSIILTPNVAEKAGMLINKRPFFLKSVELTLEFKIHSDTQTPRGDGLALWLCDQTTRFGPTHGGPQTWNGVMVALDTYNDDNSGVNPSISVHLNDGTKTYDIENEGESTRVATCPSNFLDVETSSFLHLFIEDEKLSVFIDAKGTNDWVRCSSPISVSMPSRYFFSLTASTGSDRHEVHEVISLRINTMDPKLSIEDDMNRPEEREKAKSQLHEDDAPPPETVQEQDNHSEPEVEEKKENEQINEKTEEDTQTEQQNQQKDDSRKTDPNISQEVQKMIDELEQQVNNLQTEKKNQEDYLKEAQRLLELKNNEEEHRNRDWEQKQRQLQEAQLLAQQLLREKEEEQNTGLAKYSNCNELKTECTNLRTIFQSLSDKTNSVSESFGHELVEIQYQFAQKLNDITTVLAPISSSSATIRTDTTQAKSQLSQLSRIISQLQTLLEQQVNRARDNSDKTQFSDTIENLTALQKTLVQMQVEQRKLDERQDTMREKLKRSQPSQLLEFVIALILGFQLLCQLVQKILERKQRRRARGGVLF